ncbi:MAG TPA: helix-turn-helix domain-containing protein [Anaerohalosphaeraceae bacterium]|nr:helix-turn-helix domain-containing protein [Anaerohalosphaeraceae bacterium]
MESLFITASEISRLLKFSRRTVYRLNESGAIPRPVTIGSSARWRRADIEAWIQMGCPRRDEYEAAVNRQSHKQSGR